MKYEKDDAGQIASLFLLKKPRDRRPRFGKNSRRNHNRLEQEPQGGRKGIQGAALSGAKGLIVTAIVPRSLPLSFEETKCL